MDAWQMSEQWSNVGRFPELATLSVFQPRGVLPPHRPVGKGRGEAL